MKKPVYTIGSLNNNYVCKMHTCFIKFDQIFNIKTHIQELSRLISDAFWDFLYSDKWSYGCSLRILDGQLLDYLITALYVLEQSGIVGQHTTFAFARNQRERRGCYKVSNSEKVLTIKW